MPRRRRAGVRLRVQRRFRSSGAVWEVVRTADHFQVDFMMESELPAGLTGRLGKSAAGMFRTFTFFLELYLYSFQQYHFFDFIAIS